MVEVLSSSDIHVHIPSEVDVYTDPHARMKQLIATAAKSIQLDLNNLDLQEREKILETVYAIMWELKTHELIENVFIMDKLKERLSALQIYNQLVCNCHEDSTVLQILDLVESIHCCNDVISASIYWNRLQNAIYEFMEEFVPHMEEEEKTFLPLLLKYFEYEELKEIKETVLLQHQVWKLKVQQEKNVYNLKDNLKDNQFSETKKSSSYCDKLSSLGQHQQQLSKPSVDNDTTVTIQHLPNEVLLQVFGCLTPFELVRVSSVSRRWHSVATDPTLWRTLALNSWEQSIDSWTPLDLDPEQFCTQQNLQDMYEPMETNHSDSFYQRFLRFLPKICSGVWRLNVSFSRQINDQFLHQILQICKNLKYIDVSYTLLSDNGLQNVSELGCVQHLNFAGCSNISDTTITKLSDSTGELSYLNLSGCHQLTDSAVMKLYQFTHTLNHVDFSGCYRLSGRVLSAFISECTNLAPQNLYYCNLIQDGPCAMDCNGCDNLESTARICCLKYS